MKRILIALLIPCLLLAGFFFARVFRATGSMDQLTDRVFRTVQAQMTLMVD